MDGTACSRNDDYGMPALEGIVLQKSRNALRLIYRKKATQATIADRCVLKRAIEVACEFVTR
jgi:hypothetical protein